MRSANVPILTISLLSIIQALLRTCGPWSTTLSNVVQSCRTSGKSRVTVSNQPKVDRTRIGIGPPD